MIHFSGTNLTQSNVEALNAIRDKTFGIAHQNIKKHVEKYTKAYNKRKNAQNFTLSIGERVQVRNKRKGHKFRAAWKPLNGYYLINSIDKTKNVCFIKNPKSRQILKKPVHFDDLRKYKSVRN